jgi:hypothetical protein
MGVVVFKLICILRPEKGVYDLLKHYTGWFATVIRQGCNKNMDKLFIGIRGVERI